MVLRRRRTPDDNGTEHTVPCLNCIVAVIPRGAVLSSDPRVGLRLTVARNRALGDGGDAVLSDGVVLADSVEMNGGTGVIERVFDIHNCVEVSIRTAAPSRDLCKTYQQYHPSPQRWWVRESCH